LTVQAKQKGKIYWTSGKCTNIISYIFNSNIRLPAAPGVPVQLLYQLHISATWSTICSLHSEVQSAARDHGVYWIRGEWDWRLCCHFQ